MAVHDGEDNHAVDGGGGGGGGGGGVSAADAAFMITTPRRLFHARTNDHREHPASQYQHPHHNMQSHEFESVLVPDSAEESSVSENHAIATASAHAHAATTTTTTMMSMSMSANTTMLAHERNLPESSQLYISRPTHVETGGVGGVGAESDRDDGHDDDNDGDVADDVDHVSNMSVYIDPTTSTNTSTLSHLQQQQQQYHQATVGVVDRSTTHSAIDSLAAQDSAHAQVLTQQLAEAHAQVKATEEELEKIMKERNEIETELARQVVSLL